jgi:hypothetical protein
MNLCLPRLVTAASGAASGQFLDYEEGGPEISVQTSYGIEVNVSFCFLIPMMERESLSPGINHMA